MRSKATAHPYKRGFDRGLLVFIVLVALLSGPIEAQEAELHSWVVLFEKSSLLEHDRQLGSSSASLEAKERGRLDARSPRNRDYLEHLEAWAAQRLLDLERFVQRELDHAHVYRASKVGFALSLTDLEAERLRSVSDVEAVFRDYDLTLATDAGPTWIGADEVWDGSATGGLGASRGEGVIVGVIDTGVNMAHQSFANPGGDGHDHENPWGEGVYGGWCDPSNLPAGANPGPWTCNDKLIAAWDFIDAYCAAHPMECSETDGPEDDNGHGSHTASTAAGNALPDHGIAGVAHHANLITYDVCYTTEHFGGTCPFSVLAAAVDQAILDGVDVLSFSIVGGTDPWSPSDIDHWFLSATEAGISVVAAAGNQGSSGSVNHLGPWVTTVGASIHDRLTVSTGLVDLVGGLDPPSAVVGVGRKGVHGPAPIVSAADFQVIPNAAQCGDWAEPFPPATWTNDEIVVCEPGGVDPLVKCFNARQGGAGGCVLGTFGVQPVALPFGIPGARLLDELATFDLLDWLSTGSGHFATIPSPTLVLDPEVADRMAEFSSLGPGESIDVLKPDLTAPGVEIYAATRAGFVCSCDPEPVVPGFASAELEHKDGTSMSTPHAAGASALLAALHADWSPAEIRSALVSTAEAGLLAAYGESQADTFARGGGRVALDRAARAGLLLDETAIRYQEADPDLGGDPSELNTVGLQGRDCAPSCTWNRRLSSGSGTPIEWTVSWDVPACLSLSIEPQLFELPPGESQELIVNADLEACPADAWHHGSVRLDPNLESVPSASLPLVASKPSLIFADGFESGDTSAW